MIYQVSDIKRDVRITLDENDSSQVLQALGDPDTLTLEQIIESKIVDAARTVIATAPNTMLDSGHSFAVARADTNTQIAWTESGVAGHGAGHFKLPDDFLRLVTFKMHDWDYGITEAIRDTDPLYGMQYSRYGGIRGNPQRPVVAIVNHDDGLHIEFFTCTWGPYDPSDNTGTYVERAQYIKQPTIDNGKIEIPEKLRPAVIYYTAYMVMLALNDAAFAQNLLASSKELMQTQ